jgi:hypothetical protein
VHAGWLLVSELGKEKKTLESDCETVIKTLNTSESGRSSICFILHDMKDLSRCLPDVKFQTVKREREGNRVALFFFFF